MSEVIIASYILHSSLAYLLYPNQVQFCSFVAKSHQASNKYYAKCMQQFLYVPHTWVLQGFHKLSKMVFVNFALEPSLSVFSLFFCIGTVQQPLTRKNKNLNSEKPHYRTFSCFIKNSFFWRPPQFHPLHSTKHHLPSTKKVYRILLGPKKRPYTAFSFS